MATLRRATHDVRSMYEKEILLFMVFIIIKETHCQHVIKQKINDNSGNCDGIRGAMLVEHFFNLIFIEFHNTPPRCTCVQMCANQPIYCYPNGCMKSKTLEPIQTYVQKEDKRVSLVIKDRNFAHVAKLIEETQNELNPEMPENAAEYDLVPKILKDKYMASVKYKRAPKVELRYNLRQQVNTRKMASSNIRNTDVSKSRWPNRQTTLSQKKVPAINIAKLAEKAAFRLTPLKL